MPASSQTRSESTNRTLVPRARPGWEHRQVHERLPSPVRTYKVRRRVTTGQAEALERLLPRFGVDPGRPLDPRSAFGRTAPLVVEIGSGMGEATAAMAAADPDRDVLAVEVHTPGLGNLLRLVEAGTPASLRARA